MFGIVNRDHLIAVAPPHPHWLRHRGKREPPGQRPRDPVFDVALGSLAGGFSHLGKHRLEDLRVGEQHVVWVMTPFPAETPLWWYNP